MKDKIQIISWLLTRKCNLKCSYCRIVRSYKNKPDEYPDVSHYHKNEMTTDYVIEGLRRFKLHNPDAFHILYGGEPLLFKGLVDIVNYCNKEKIHYTIITNNSPEIQKQIEDLLLKTDNIEGITSSVDPIIFSENLSDDDRIKKSIEGLKRLKQYKGIIKDIVAEITVDKNTIKYLHRLVKELTKHGINSDITTVDIAKNPYYDFSNVTDDSNLVPKTKEVLDVFNKIIDDNLDVHMAKTLLPEIYKILPANLDCKMEKSLNTLCVDSDGSLRLCLRIRGVETPNQKLHDYLLEDGKLAPTLKRRIVRDKKNYCKLCNHTCYIMGNLVEKENDVSKLVHFDKRKKED